MFGRYFISLDLTGKKCLVVGGGQVAERKVRSLLDCNACVYVVSPEISPGLKSLVERGSIFYRRGCYRSLDLEDAFLVIGSTSNEDVNRQVAEDCSVRNIVVNIVDDPTKGNFFVPATVSRGFLNIAISTSGKSPLFARKIREELEIRYGPHYGDFLDMLGSLREDIIGRISDPEKKKAVLESLVDDETLGLLKNKQMDLVKERLLSAYRGSWS